jgi:hypothetical protein
LPRVVHWDHNIYENTTGYWGWGSATYKTFAGFQAACGCDLIGSTSTSTDYSTSLGVPMTGSPVLDAGTDLCGVLGCTTSLQPLTKDTSAGNTRNPVLRPTGANAWDIGAYQVSNISSPAPPTGLTATVQ